MAIELPFKGNVVAFNDRLANHLPLQIRHGIDKQLDDFIPGRFPADLRDPYGRIQKLPVFSKVLRRRIGVMLVPGTHVSIDDAPGALFFRCNRQLGEQEHAKEANETYRQSTHGISSSIIAVVVETETGISGALRVGHGLSRRWQFNQ